MATKAMKAALGLKSAIKPVATDLKDVDFLTVASPIWAQKIPPYINKYLSELTYCSGKPFSVIVEMRGTGAENAIAVIQKQLEKKGMRFVSSIATLESEVDSGAFESKTDDFGRTIRQEAGDHTVYIR